MAIRFTTGNFEPGDTVHKATGIDETYLAPFQNGKIEAVILNDGTTIYKCTWMNSVAFDPTVGTNAFNNFPVGSEVRDIPAGKLWWLRSAGSWKYQAVNT